MCYEICNYAVFVFATSLGGDCVLQFRFDAASGRLQPNEPPAVAVRAGSGVGHVFSWGALKAVRSSAPLLADGTGSDS